MTAEEKITKCSGLMTFCWPWREKYAPSSFQIQDYMKFPEAIMAKRVAVIVYGKKKADKIAMSFCPFCGADYKERLK